ncbi:MAG: ChaN family lipoprotein [bacterium]
MFKPHVIFVAVSLIGLFGCQSKITTDVGHSGNGTATTHSLTAHVKVVDYALGDIVTPAVVYVGELHDQYAYHLNQLAVISALKQRGLNVAVGFEMIQIPFQKPLDDFATGQIDFATMLMRTEYFSRWRIDPSHYQPVFQYARTHRLPLVALNAAKETTDRVSEVGIEGLDQEQRSTLPGNLVEPDREYRAQLKRIFEQHEHGENNDLDRFIQVQRTWDETMGKSSVDFLRKHPDHVLVVLAGIQHVAHGYGIPSRVSHDLKVNSLIVLSESEQDSMADGADIFLPLIDEKLPGKGRMGVFISDVPSGALVSGLAPDSPAKRAGVEKNDLIVNINDHNIDGFDDIKMLLWDKLPGYQVSLEVQRGDDSRKMSFKLY